MHGYYLSLSSTIGMLFPWKLVWHLKVHPRVAFFSWTAALGKIFSSDYLRKKVNIIVDCCYMCQPSRESVDDLILHWLVV